MKTIAGNLTVIRGLKDLQLISIFVIPESDWNNYYVPLESNLNRVRLEKQQDESWSETLQSIQTEIETFKKHGKHYGYVYYILKKVEHL